MVPNRKAPAPLPPAQPKALHQTIAAGAQADRSTDTNHHTQIPLPPASASANPPRTIAEHWQSLLAETTTLLGYEITLQPDRPTSAHPAIPAKPGLNDRVSMDNESFAPGVRPTLARTAATKSHFTPATTTAHPPRLPRHRKRSSCRGFGVGFRVVA